VVGRRLETFQHARRGEQHAAGADRRHRAAAVAVRDERPADVAALCLCPRPLGRAVVPAAAGHQQEVWVAGPCAVRPHGHAVAAGDLVARVERDERDFDRSAALRGVGEDLVRAEGVELVEALEDEDRDLQG
jgi:hypothetical protein